MNLIDEFIHCWVHAWEELTVSLHAPSYSRGKRWKCQIKAQQSQSRSTRQWTQPHFLEWGGKAKDCWRPHDPPSHTPSSGSAVTTRRLLARKASHAQLLRVLGPARRTLLGLQHEGLASGKSLQDPAADCTSLAWKWRKILSNYSEILLTSLVRTAGLRENLLLVQIRGMTGSASFNFPVSSAGETGPPLTAGAWRVSRLRGWDIFTLEGVFQSCRTPSCPQDSTRQYQRMRIGVPQCLVDFFVSICFVHELLPLLQRKYHRRHVVTKWDAWNSNWC